LLDDGQDVLLEGTIAYAPITKFAVGAALLVYVAFVTYVMISSLHTLWAPLSVYAILAASIHSNGRIVGRVREQSLVAALERAGFVLCG